MSASSRKLCLGCVLVWSVTQVFGFTLDGVLAPWQTPRLGYDLSASLFGGPMNLDEGYRWNVPVVTYGFDASFLEYFGSNGVAEVERAIDVVNNLPPASQLDPTSYPTQVIRVNSQAASQGLIDLKSVTMFLLIEHLGLAEPQRFTFCLRNSVQTSDGFQDLVIQRNFDPSSPFGGKNDITLRRQSPSKATGDLQDFYGFMTTPFGNFGRVPTRPLESERASGGGR